MTAITNDPATDVSGRFGRRLLVSSPGISTD